MYSLLSPFLSFEAHTCAVVVPELRLFGRYTVGRVRSSRMLTLPMFGSTSSTGPCACIDTHTPRGSTTATARRRPTKRNATKIISCIISAHAGRTCTPQMPSLSRSLDETAPRARVLKQVVAIKAARNRAPDHFLRNLASPTKRSHFLPRPASWRRRHRRH